MTPYIPPKFKLTEMGKRSYDIATRIRESLKADFYAPLEYIAKHRYARALLTNLFNTPMDGCLEQEVLVSSIIVDSEDNLKFIKAAKQLDTLVDLGAAERSDSILDQRYAITLKGHDALATYQNLFDEALALKKNDRKQARMLVINWLEAAANPQEKP